jgi:hypothetical protein
MMRIMMIGDSRSRGGLLSRRRGRLIGQKTAKRSQRKMRSQRRTTGRGKGEDKGSRSR